MKKVLVIQSSLQHENGNSTKLTNTYIDALNQKGDVEVVVRNIAQDDLPHLTGEEMGAWMTAPEDRDEKQQALAAISDNLVEEVKAADEIVLGVPMYNFGIPSILKAWIDRVARAGVTFRYTENGPQGLLDSAKKVVVLGARGGIYQGTEYDTQSLYLTHFFNFVGLTDVNFVYAEGLSMGEEAAEKSFSAANEKIIELIG